MVRDGRFCACRAEKGKKKGKKNGKKNGVSRKGDPGNPVRAPRPAKALTTADCNLFYAVVAFRLFRSVCNGFRIGSGPFRNGYGNFSGPGGSALSVLFIGVLSGNLLGQHCRNLFVVYEFDDELAAAAAEGVEFGVSLIYTPPSHTECS